MAKKNENSIAKGKTLFDHLKEVLQIKREDYWSTLSESDRKTFSVYMVNKYLSMSQDFIETVDDLQAYTLSMPPEVVYKLYRDIFPRSSEFLKFIKSQNEVKYSKELIEIMMQYYSLSRHEAIDYLNILYATEENKKEVERIVSAYGNDEKEIKKIMKV